jgi:hypothetical protein
MAVVVPMDDETLARKRMAQLKGLGAHRKIGRSGIIARWQG